MARVNKRKQASDSTLREAYWAYWAPQSFTCIPGKTGMPQWKEAARAVDKRLPDGTIVEGVSRDTLYRARKWALERGLACRPLRGGHKLKLSAVVAYALCKEVSDPERACTIESLLRAYKVSRKTLARYLPLFKSGELARRAALEAAMPNVPADDEQPVDNPYY